MQDLRLPISTVSVDNRKMTSPIHPVVSSGEEEIFFIFDGDCGICTRAVELLRHIVRTTLVFVPYQIAPLHELGLTSKDCNRAAQVVSELGTREEGYDAFRFAFLSSPLLSARLVAWFMTRGLVRPMGRFVYSRVALARHSGVFGGEIGACRLPPTDSAKKASGRVGGWQKLKSSHSNNPKSVVDTITLQGEEVLANWGRFTKQLMLVSSVWALGAILLAMRLIYGSIVGYGWGWQMYS